MKEFDVVIVGAGVTGTALAYILTNFTTILTQMARVIKENKFQEKVTFILNDVAEVVLNWNLGHITNDEAIKKIKEIL